MRTPEIKKNKTFSIEFEIILSLCIYQSFITDSYSLMLQMCWIVTVDIKMITRKPSGDLWSLAQGLFLPLIKRASTLCLLGNWTAAFSYASPFTLSSAILRLSRFSANSFLNKAFFLYHKCWEPIQASTCTHILLYLIMGGTFSYTP